jgi:PTH2 family peptidyl-tRNA hydrolase
MLAKFPDGKGGWLSPRKGKLIAQGAHASLAFLTRRIEFYTVDDFVTTKGLDLTPAMREWMEDSFAKICVRADSLEQLMDIFNKAEQAGLEVHLVKDSGRTEFKEPTITCLAIGPDYDENIDPITGHLKLL